MKIKSLFIASLEKNAGGLVVSIGLMDMLKKKLQKVAFFRPIIQENDPRENDDITFMMKHYDLKMDYDETFVFTLLEAESLIAQNRQNYLFEKIIEKFETLEKKYDFILCEGISKSLFTSTVDFDINLEIAKNIGSPVAGVLSGKNKSSKEIWEEVMIESDTIKDEECVHFATFVNRLDKESLIDLTNKVRFLKKSDTPIYLLPEVKELSYPTIKEVNDSIKSACILGNDKDMKRLVRQTKIAAMNLDHFLMRLEDGDLIIVPGDRLDMILGSIAANYSKDFPSISGIVLTGGYIPDEIFMKLIEGVGEFTIPILSSKEDTFTTAVKVNETDAKIMPDSLNKIAIIEGLFATYIDTNHIEEKIDTAQSSSITTPAMFEYRMFEKARKNIKTIVLPESEDERILRATDILQRRRVVNIILLGDPNKISSRCSSLGINLRNNIIIVDPQKSELKNRYSKKLYELRKHKGMTKEGAYDILNNKNYFATMMIYMGDADGMVSGANNTTADTIRPALQIIKTKPGISIVSSVFFMCLDTKVLVYGDCAVNPDPDAEQLAQIAISSADTAKLFGIEPIVAMLSYSTGDSGSGKDVQKVAEATKIVKNLRPDLLVEGPIQYDAAIDEKVAKKKLPNSKVAGRATVFIFPDLNTGNNTYKAVQRSSNAIAVGPVLQGLKKPVNDLSRGCLVEDIVNTVAITAIQAGEEI